MMNIDLTWISFFPGIQVLPPIIEKIAGIWLLMISVDVIYFVFLDLQVMPAIMEKIDGIYFVMITVDLIFFVSFRAYKSCRP